MTDEQEQEQEGPEGFEPFEVELGARLRDVADGVGRSPSRQAVDAAVVHLQARQRRVRRAGALAAAAVVLVAGGVVAVVASSADERSVEVSAGSSSTTMSPCLDLSGGDRYEAGDPRCGDPACIEPSALVVDGVQVAYGYDWGIELSSGRALRLDRAFGPRGVPSGLVVVTPAQGVILLEDSVLTVTPSGPDDEVGLRMTLQVAVDLADHGVPVTADQLAHLRYPAAGTEVDATQVVFSPGDGSRGGACALDGAATTTTTAAATTSTSTTTVPDTTTTTVPETTTTTSPIPPKPPELSTFTEGGQVWAVYVTAYLLGPDFMDSVDVWEGEGQGAQLIRYGYRGLANPIDCDQGGDAAFPGYQVDPRNTGYVVGAYFATEAEAEVFAANYPYETYGPVSVRTTCVDQPFPGSGQTRDTVQGEVLD